MKIDRVDILWEAAAVTSKAAGVMVGGLLYIIFNPIPGPIDDVAVAAIGGYHALKRL